MRDYTPSSETAPIEGKPEMRWAAQLPPLIPSSAGFSLWRGRCTLETEGSQRRLTRWSSESRSTSGSAALSLSFERVEEQNGRI